MRKYLIIVLIIALLTIGLYYPILNNFFQQDEWIGFAQLYMVGRENFWKYILLAFVPDPGHFVPFYKVLLATLFRFFEIDYTKWAIVSIVLHVANSVLVFFLAKKKFKDYFYSTCAALLFVVYAAGQQATSWVVADGATHVATFFVLFSCVMFLESKIILSLVLLVVSMLFKEISIGMSLFIPIVICTQNSGLKKTIVDRRVVYFLTAGIAYFLFRYLTFLGVLSDISSPVITQSQSLKEILLNIFTFPVKVVSQTLVPPYILLEMSKLVASKLPDEISGNPGTSFFDLFYLKYVFQFMVYLTFFGVLIFLVKIRKNKFFPQIMLSFVFVLVNSVVYALSPGRGGFVPVIDSRNLYLPSIGTIFLIIFISKGVFKSGKFVAFPIFVFFLVNLTVTRIELIKLGDLSQYRGAILSQIYDENPDLKDKQIFYFESDTSYYGLPETVKILPFQSGLGQTLLVWYHRSENFNNAFFENEFLWPIDSQGCKEVGDRGFGYYREFEALIDSVRKNKIPVANVIGYRWDSHTSSLVEISAEVRKKLNDNNKVYK